MRGDGPQPSPAFGSAPAFAAPAGGSCSTGDCGGAAGGGVGVGVRVGVGVLVGVAVRVGVAVPVAVAVAVGVDVPVAVGVAVGVPVGVGVNVGVSVGTGVSVGVAVGVSVWAVAGAGRAKAPLAATNATTPAMANHLNARRKAASLTLEWSQYSRFGGIGDVPQEGMGFPNAGPSAPHVHVEMGVPAVSPCWSARMPMPRSYKWPSAWSADAGASRSAVPTAAVPTSVFATTLRKMSEVIIWGGHGETRRWRRTTDVRSLD